MSSNSLHHLFNSFSYHSFNLTSLSDRQTTLKLHQTRAQMTLISSSYANALSDDTHLVLLTILRSRQHLRNPTSSPIFPTLSLFFAYLPPEPTETVFVVTTDSYAIESPSILFTSSTPSIAHPEIHYQQCSFLRHHETYYRMSTNRWPLLSLYNNG